MNIIERKSTVKSVFHVQCRRHLHVAEHKELTPQRLGPMLQISATYLEHGMLAAHGGVRVPTGSLRGDWTLLCGITRIRGAGFRGGSPRACCQGARRWLGLPF